MKSCFGIILSVMLCGAFTASAEPMSFHAVSNGGNAADCCWIVADGEVTEETPDTFRRFIEEGSYLPNAVRINGYGLDYGSAIELGRLIRDQGMDTVMGLSSQVQGDSWWQRAEGGECIEACFMAFLGGNVRGVPPETIVRISQFHEVSLTDALSGTQQDSEQALVRRVERQAATGRIVEYIIEMGVDPRLYALATGVELTSAGLSLTDEQIVEFGIDNAGDAAGPWQAHPFGDGFYSEVVTRHTSRSLMLYCLVDGRNFIGILFPFSTFETFFQGSGQDESQVENLLNGFFADSGGQVSISTDLGLLEGSLDAFTRTDDEQFFVSFSIDQVTAGTIAQASRLSVWPRDVQLSRASEGWFAPFNFANIYGDHNLPRQTLRVCRS